jgi:signal transduction histidine kinase
MFILSGELDIISRTIMLKKTFTRLFNLHFVIFMILLVSGILITLILSNSILSAYKDSCASLKANDLSAYCSRIVNQLKVTDYLNSTNDTINNELDVAAELYNGRIIVVNSALEIIYDSYGRDTGKTAVMKEVLNSFNGNDISQADFENEMGVYTCSIKSDSKNINVGCILFTYSLENEVTTYNYLSRFFLILGSVIIITVLIIGFVLSSIITASLKRLRRQTALISAGHPETVLEEKGLYEFKMIARSVNDMMVKVRATEEAQQEFVSNVSHELKTPMASMKVLADSLLMQDTADVAMYREFLGDINEEITRENKIISDLLELVRMDKKTTKLKISLYSMNEIMGVVIKRVTPLAENLNIKVIYESYREISAEVDDNKLIMAITNICENAVKYNKEMGTVRVGLNADTQFCYITVEDTGVGIPQDSLNHIFERFYRIDKARDRETGGTGLGLSIANEIVRLHHGEIKVFSQENEGTTFNIRLPLSYQTTNVMVHVKDQ